MVKVAFQIKGEMSEESIQVIKIFSKPLADSQGRKEGKREREMEGGREEREIEEVRKDN